ncbi:MAG: hypothetical protein QXG39_04795 [Candidatus Aenigmatarchaeota archaeon]
MPHKHYLILLYGNRKENEKCLEEIEKILENQGMVREIRMFDLNVGTNKADEQLKKLFSKHSSHHAFKFLHFLSNFARFFIFAKDIKFRKPKFKPKNFSSPNIEVLFEINEPKTTDGDYKYD